MLVSDFQTDIKGNVAKLLDGQPEAMVKFLEDTGLSDLQLLQGNDDLKIWNTQQALFNNIQYMPECETIFGLNRSLCEKVATSIDGSLILLSAAIALGVDMDRVRLALVNDSMKSIVLYRVSDTRVVAICWHDPACVLRHPKFKKQVQ